MNLFQWPGLNWGGARNADSPDILDPTSCHFFPEPRKNFLCPLIAYAFHCLIVDPLAMCTKGLTPILGRMTENDVFGFEALFRTMMPDPAGGDELVLMFSWEFLATLSVFVAMSPWYSWRVSPGSQQRGLDMGDPRIADRWYDAKLRFYRTYTRAQVANALKAKLIRFYTECPAAWEEVLAVKGAAQLGGGVGGGGAAALADGEAPIDEAPPGDD